MSNGLCSACDFPITVGGTYECRDTKQRTIVRIEHGYISYREGNSRLQMISTSRFSAMVIRMIAWQAVA